MSKDATIGDHFGAFAEPQVDRVSGLEHALQAIESRRSRSPRRLMVAVVGAPGSGKSAFADELASMVLRRTTRIAAVVAQDGFHLDNAVLDRMGRRAQKGAPDTFDVEGLWHLLRRLRRGGGYDVLVPVFDRGRDAVEELEHFVPSVTNVVIVEGNYLLSTTPPWDRLRAFFDLTIMLTCTTETLRSRLTQRWLDHGLTPEAAAARAEENDLRNAYLVAERSAAADLVIPND